MNVTMTDFRHKIAIDIDQTLYDFDSEVREAFFELALEREDKSLLRGAYSTNMEWRNLTDVLGEKIGLEAIQKVHNKTMEQVPFKGSVETVQRLSEHFKIIYVTSRYDKFQHATEDWLHYNEFPYGRVICSTHDKKPHLEDSQYLIDDRPKTIIEFVTTENKRGMPRKAFGLWTNYNRNLTDIKNVYLAPTWKGIAFYLERKGLL